jgi:hypothetical protein
VEVLQLNTIGDNFLMMFDDFQYATLSISGSVSTQACGIFGSNTRVSCIPAIFVEIFMDNLGAKIGLTTWSSREQRVRRLDLRDIVLMDL